MLVDEELEGRQADDAFGVDLRADPGDDVRDVLEVAVLDFGAEGTLELLHLLHGEDVGVGRRQVVAFLVLGRSNGGCQLSCRQIVGVDVLLGVESAAILRFLVQLDLELGECAPELDALDLLLDAFELPLAQGLSRLLLLALVVDLVLLSLITFATGVVPNLLIDEIGLFLVVPEVVRDDLPAVGLAVMPGLAGIAVAVGTLPWSIEGSVGWSLVGGAR